jgi:hypothetical protein
MPVRKSSKRKKNRKQLKSPGFTGWAIIFLSVFIIVFVVSMMIPGGDVEIVPEDTDIIRLQLKNGCGINGAAEDMTRALMTSSPGVMFDVIDKSNAETFNFERTLIVDRKGDPVNAGAYSKAAVFMAELLRVEPDQLILQKLSDNLLDIDVTIIIGSDYESKMNLLRSEVK